MHEINANSGTQTNSGYTSASNIAVDLLGYAAEGIFQVANSEDTQKQEPDLLEEMENFLNEPYNEEQQEEEPSFIAELISRFLITSFLNYIKPEEV